MEEPSPVMEEPSYEVQLAETDRAYEATAQRYKARWHTRDPLVEEKERYMALTGPAASLVDLGCGTGRDVAWFLQRGNRVVGVDRSQAMLQIAQESVPGARLIRADIRRLPLRDRGVDGWWASAVLLHLGPADVSRALREAHRITRPGGVGFVAVREGVGARFEPVDDTSYRRYFFYWQASALDDVLAETGWDVQDARMAPDSEGRHRWLIRLVRRASRFSR
jgi:ubiquinone/menaquinone biosynthesis C-methylase UbiE